MWKNKIAIAFIIVIAFALTILLIALFVHEERNIRGEVTINLLSDEANRDAAIVRNLFDSHKDTLRALAFYTQTFDDLSSAETITFLKEMAGSFGLERLSIHFPDGKTYTTDGHEPIITQGNLLESVKSGQAFVANLNIDGVPAVHIGVPISKDDAPVASLGYSMTRERLNGLLNTLLSKEGKYSYIIGEYGEYVAFDGDPRFTGEVTFFNMLDEYTYGRAYSKELIVDDFANAREGHTEYSYAALERFERHGYYAPVGINNWMIMSVMSKNDIDADTNRFVRSAVTLAARILLIFLAVAFFVFLDLITTRLREEKRLRRKADTDGLTGFYNKTAAEAFINEAILSSSSETTHALFCIDIDNFKGINDGFGHLYGDKVLQEIAETMRKLFRTSDIIGRFGGDEFVIFVHDVPNIEFVKERAAELNRRLEKTYREGDAECTVSASIGIAVFPADGADYETLYKKADEASYAAKNSGKNSYSFAAADGETIKKSKEN